MDVLLLSIVGEPSIATKSAQALASGSAVVLRRHVRSRVQEEWSIAQAQSSFISSSSTQWYGEPFKSSLDAFTLTAFMPSSATSTFVWEFG